MLVEFEKVTKRFPLTVANDAVTFSIQENSIHGIVGENGAGKSTIMKLLYGMYPLDSGEIRVRGSQQKFRSPLDAIGIGIGMVHQHFMLIPRLTVWENILLGQENSFWISAEKASELLSPLMKDCPFQLTDLVEELSVGLRQQVEILKLLYRRSEILILDEPTAVLTPQETKDLFNRLRDLKGAKTIIIITHKISEILELTDTVTVMRQGRVVTTKPTRSLDATSLTALIMGKAGTPQRTRATTPLSESILELSHVTSQKGRTPLNDISFKIRGGEIYGIAGISGNGQEALVEAISGLSPLSSGEIKFKGSPMKANPYDRFSEGLALIPPDRLEEAVIPGFSVEMNSLLGFHKDNHFQKWGFYSSQAVKAHARTIIDSYFVTPALGDVRLSTLSGGNQQKVVVGRALSRSPSLIVAAYPTRGVDIGATQQIHDELLKRRNEGAAILIISSELDEILALSDTIAVLFEGRLVGEMTRNIATELTLGRWMVGSP